MRDRLINTIKKVDLCNKNDCVNCLNCKYEDIADRLIATGVILPPCKVGDIAYQHIYHKNGYSHTLKEIVVGIHIIDAPSRHGHTRENYIITYNENTNSIRHINFDKIGKTVFFTYAEAKQALKGCE